MGNIRDRIQESLDIIANFGLGETEFYTADIERLIREKQALWSFLQKIGTDPNSIV